MTLREFPRQRSTPRRLPSDGIAGTEIVAAFEAGRLTRTEKQQLAMLENEYLLAAHFGEPMHEPQATQLQQLRRKARG